MTPFVQHAVAAALSIVAGFGGPGVVGPLGDRTATAAELQVLFEEAEAFAPVASRWAGYRIPPEVVYAVGTEESCWRNLCRHCRGGGPNNQRSAGYFAITSMCAVMGADGIGVLLSMPPTDETNATEVICDWTVAHPRYQVRIVLQRLALHVRERHGDLWGALADYGPEGADRDYPADIRRIWIRTFPASWPRNGRL